MNTDFFSVVEENKSDPFVRIVYEDCSRQTDMINDCLSPRWLPWTQRAFILHMTHPSSQIFLGVFDYDKVSSNDFLGKVSVDITHLRPQTEYVLDYKLFNSLMSKEQEPGVEGTIKVCFS